LTVISGSETVEGTTGRSDAFEFGKESMSEVNAS
jgi:hypothetical protein